LAGKCRQRGENILGLKKIQPRHRLANLKNGARSDLRELCSSLKRSQHGVAGVAPHAGARIETINPRPDNCLEEVAPHAGRGLKAAPTDSLQ